MQGWRISMEDSHTAVLDLLGKGANTPVDDKLSFFGVYDGHGGDKVALFTGENIHNIIAKQETFKAGDYTQGLKDGFLATDRAILNGMRARRAQLPRTPHTVKFYQCRMLTYTLFLSRPKVRRGSLWLHSLCWFDSWQKTLRGMLIGDRKL